MKHAVIATALAVLSVVTLAQQAPTVRPPQPFVEQGLCPGEGCTYGRWTAITTVLAIANPPPPPYNPILPGREKPVFVVNPGDIVTAETGTYVTLVPGRARIGKPLRVSIQPPPGSPESANRNLGTMDLAADAEVFVYSSTEGMHNAWFNGRWFTFEEITHGRVVERAKSIWWSRIRNKSGAVGWTDQHRAFDGIDRLSAYPTSYAFFHKPFSWEPAWLDFVPGIRMQPSVGASSTMTIAEIQPGARTPAHHHSFPQVNYALEGELQVTVSGHNTTLKPDAGIAVPSDSEHFIANTGKTPALMLEFQPVRRFDLLPVRPQPAFGVADKPIPSAPRTAMQPTANTSGPAAASHPPPCCRSNRPSAPTATALVNVPSSIHAWIHIHRKLRLETARKRTSIGRSNSPMSQNAAPVRKTTNAATSRIPTGRALIAAQAQAFA